MTPTLAAALERIRPDVRAMHAYVVQGAEGLLKLDAMENPFGLPPTLQAALGSTATPARATTRCAPRWRTMPVCPRAMR